MSKLYRHFPITVFLAVASGLLLLASAASAQDDADAPEGPRDERLSQWQDPATAPAELMPRAPYAITLGSTNTRDRAVAVGERGHILVSESRRDWRQVPAPTRATLTAVTAHDNQAWAVGHDQVIVYSSDGGLTWSHQHHDVTANGPLLAVLALDASRVVAIGAYGQYLRTEDAGSTWSVHVISEFTAEDESKGPSNATRDDEFGDLASSDIGEEEGDPHLNGIAKLTDGTLVIVGERGAYYLSRDSAQSWERFQFDYDGSMFGVVAPDDGSAVAYGLRGNAFSSSDSGRTWTELNTDTDLSLLGGATLPGGRVAIVGANGLVLLKPAGSLDVRRYTYAEGGVLATVLPIGDAEFVLGGENGLAIYEPSTGRVEEPVR